MFDLDHIFTHHPPKDQAQLDAYAAIHDAGKALCEVIVKHTPAGADQSVAVRHVRDAVMTSNASIALEGRL